MADMKKIGDLKKWDKNPRKITPSKARILVKTLLQFGDLSGIVYNTRSKTLVGGHQRYDALSSAEIQITETFAQPTRQGTTALGWAVLDGERFAYREVSWDDQTHTAAAIAANKGAGEWDTSSLKDLILDLDTGALDMELTGFDLPEIENIVNAYKDFEPLRGLTQGSDGPGNNVAKEYEGMPDYDHVDDTPWKKIVVKFENEMVFKEFCKRIEQDLTDSTKTIWYPERDRRVMTDLAYKIEGEDVEPEQD